MFTRSVIIHQPISNTQRRKDYLPVIAPEIPDMRQVINLFDSSQSSMRLWTQGSFQEYSILTFSPWQWYIYLSTTT